MKNLKLSLCVLIVLLTSAGLKAQAAAVTDTSCYKHSIEFSPMSPFINIYGIQYGYSFDEKNDLILGLAYMSIPHENVGRTHASNLIVGYRRNFGSGWHAEYSLYPTYDNYFETNEKKYYNSFDLWNEFRFGYQYDFNISQIPVFVKAQIPFGFALYAQNKPKSFRDMEKKGDNRFFYKAVLVYFGIRF
ncbi:MAG: hypothetical protein ACM3P0_04810 [Acidobacteriota bacterium]